MPKYVPPFGQGGFNSPTGAMGVNAGVGHGARTNNPAAMPGTPHVVKATQFFFLNMAVPFTATAGENTNAGTFLEQFPILIRGAWTNLNDVRVRFTEQQSGDRLSSDAVPILGLAGRTDKTYPMLYWKTPLLLSANSQLRGDFINDGGEEAGNVVFFCSRPDIQIDVPVRASKEYRLLLDLGLDSADTTTINSTQTQQVNFDMLIYGAMSTVSGVTIQLLDTRANINWSSQQLPIGAFAGLRTEVSPIMHYAQPYYLPKNSTIRANYINAGAEDNGFVEFICQRILY